MSLFLKSFIILLIVIVSFNSKTIADTISETDFEYMSFETPILTVDGNVSSYNFIFSKIEIYDDGIIGFDTLDLPSPGISMKPYVYPNPFRLESGAELGYELTVGMQIEIRIYDMFGHEIYQQEYGADTMGGFGWPLYNKIKLDRSSFGGYDLPSGVYFIVLINNGKVIAKTKMAVRP